VGAVRTEGTGPRGVALVFLADQAIVSAVRFGVAWILARQTAPENYGAYALIVSLLFVVEIVQHALVIWPMAVLGAAREGDAFRSYASAAGRAQAWVAGGSAVAVFAAVQVMPADWFGNRRLAYGLAAAALSAAQQLQEFARRVLLTKRPVRALANDALMAVAVLGGIVGLFLSTGHDARAVASDRVIVLYALGLAVAAVAGGLQTRDLRGGRREPAGAVLHENWSFGRFILGSRIGESLLNHVQNFVLGAFAGPAGVAGLQAARLLVSPLQVASFATLNFLLPRGAERLREGGPRALDRLVVGATGAFTAAALGYALVLAAAPSWWLGLVYGGRYDEPLILRLCAAVQVVATARFLLSSSLYVRRRSDLIMTAVLTCGVGAMVLVQWLGRQWGAAGILWALLLAEGVLLLWIALAMRRAGAPVDAAQ
jgi:O-antigen/teichoic acid export membrane protein